MKGTTPSLSSPSSKITHVRTQSIHTTRTHLISRHIIMYLINDSVFWELKSDKTISIKMLNKFYELIY